MKQQTWMGAVEESPLGRIWTAVSINGLAAAPGRELAHLKVTAER